MPSKMTEVFENPVKGWVTMKEAGRIIDRDTSTIRYWAETGKIACFNIGTSNIRIVNVEQVKEYSANHSYRLDRPKRSQKKENG